MDELDHSTHILDILKKVLKIDPFWTLPPLVWIFHTFFFHFEYLPISKAWDISEEYTAALVEEVTQHLVEEVVEYEGLDQDSTAAHFIRAKVSQNIRDKLASLDVAD